MLEKVRVCKECGKNYIKPTLKKKRKNGRKRPLTIGNTYCSEQCRSIVRSRTNYKQRKKVKDARENPSEENREWLVNKIYRRYKISAKKRGLEWGIAQEEMNRYWQAMCHYCGQKISAIGLDRKDNSIGYIQGNILPCCETCNRMKRAQDYIEFIDKCKMVAFAHRFTERTRH